jgi:protocatechuate 3,4-dioxygenase beta subunit
MLRIILSYFFIISISSCSKSQENNIDGKLVGSCEGCEAVFEYGNKKLSAVDTLPGFFEEGEKLYLSGTIFKNDGITPAEGVILYIYHTNQDGIYAPKKSSSGLEKRHGYMRGWIKTGKDGRYEFYTIRPASYPNSNAPAHIHPVILEPDGKYYWISEYLFADDPNLNKNQAEENPRGGNGVLTVNRQGNTLKAERNIILGRNVPGY